MNRTAKKQIVIIQNGSKQIKIIQLDQNGSNLIKVDQKSQYGSYRVENRVILTLLKSVVAVWSRCGPVWWSILGQIGSRSPNMGHTGSKIGLFWPCWGVWSRCGPGVVRCDGLFLIYIGKKGLKYRCGVSVMVYSTCIFLYWNLLIKLLQKWSLCSRCGVVWSGVQIKDIRMMFIALLYLISLFWWKTHHFGTIWKFFCNENVYQTLNKSSSNLRPPLT